MLWFPQTYSALKNFWLCACLWWLHSNFFNESQKETDFLINGNEDVKCSFPVNFVFNMSTWCSDRSTQPETIFFSVDFLFFIVYLYMFVYMKKYSFYLCKSPSVFTVFHIFIVTPLSGCSTVKWFIRLGLDPNRGFTALLLTSCKGNLLTQVVCSFHSQTLSLTSKIGHSKKMEVGFKS